jgi:hypothetical protein
VYDVYPIGQVLSYARVVYANLRIAPEQIDANGQATICRICSIILFAVSLKTNLTLRESTNNLADWTGSGAGGFHHGHRSEGAQ